MFSSFKPEASCTDSTGSEGGTESVPIALICCCQNAIRLHIRLWDRAVDVFPEALVVPMRRRAHDRVAQLSRALKALTQAERRSGLADVPRDVRESRRAVEATTARLTRVPSHRDTSTGF